MPDSTKLNLTPWQRLRLWLRPPRQLKTTTLGKLVIVFAIVIGVAATNTGNNLLYLVLGGLFGIIAASGVLSERILKGIDVQLHLPPAAIANRVVGCAVTLLADKRIDSFLLDIQLIDDQRKPLGTATVRELLRGVTRTATVPFSPACRGSHTIAAVRIATRFPFQMYEKSRLYSSGKLLWCAPEPAPATLPSFRSHQGQILTKKNRRQDGTEFRGLRDRQNSDGLSRIHWKRAAATGKHVVKVFAANEEPHISIELSRGASDDDFEQGLSDVMGILEQARRQQRTVTVNAGKQTAVLDSDSAGWFDALLLLAKLDRQTLPAGTTVMQMDVAA